MAAATTAIALCSLVAFHPATGAAEAGRGPKVVQLSYSESDDGSRPRKRLDAFARRTDSLRFATRFDGRGASAGSRYDESVTDTDLRGEASHPWRIERNRDGKRVLRLVEAALDERGRAKVKVRAKRDGQVDEVRFEIVLERCSQDPPLYPVDCEVKRNGDHV